MNKRIIFLDLMRAFAVLMMVQGHTIDMLLANQFRDNNSFIYYSWNFMRGMTAPIFLFTAGTVFTYLFVLQNKKATDNPRLRKGLKRFLLLVFLGYLLHYPTAKIIDFSSVTAEQWKAFFAVDVLQLIGFGILFLIALLYLSEKIKIKPSYLFLTFGLLFIYLNPVVQSIEWKSFLPVQIAGYFYSGTGSNFPLFPWCSYLFFGGILGYHLAAHTGGHKKPKFGISLFLIGAALIISAFAGDRMEIIINGTSDFWGDSPNLILYRLGIVLILNSIFCLVAVKVEKIPNLIILIGRHTLSIYFVHLIILYGSTWSLGVSYFMADSLDIWKSIGSALIMILLMIGMVISIRMIKFKNKVITT
ncbi:MAG: acyltransferase [Bacteroidetes bacterium]|nr:acyltransferase [Bacteroidota bacterium]